MPLKQQFSPMDVIRQILLFRGLWVQIKMDFWLRVGQVCWKEWWSWFGWDWIWNSSRLFLSVIWFGPSKGQRMCCLWSINYYYYITVQSFHRLMNRNRPWHAKNGWGIKQKSSSVIYIKEGISVYLSHIWRASIDFVLNRTEFWSTIHFYTRERKDLDY